MPNQQVMDAWLESQRLPKSYQDTAKHWFDPLAQAIAAQHKQQGKPLITTVHGCQGSGKTTLAEYLGLLLSEDHGLITLCVSLDDFYLTRAHRLQLAETVHPLLAVRGVPGTHDVPLAITTLQQLVATGASREVAVPRFDKATDDRAAMSDWQQVIAPADVVILEGWCVGTPPQSEDQLASPINELEQNKDPDARWRRYVNRALAGDYQTLFGLADYQVMLKAPSFNCVYRWRLEQEQKLAQSTVASGADHVMSEHQIAQFIQLFQRLTEHALAVMPASVDYLLRMAEDRSIISSIPPSEKNL